MHLPHVICSQVLYVGEHCVQEWCPVVLTGCFGLVPCEHFVRLSKIRWDHLSDLPVAMYTGSLLFSVVPWHFLIRSLLWIALDQVACKLIYACKIFVSVGQTYRRALGSFATGHWWGCAMNIYYAFPFLTDFENLWVIYIFKLFLYLLLGRKWISICWLYCANLLLCYCGHLRVVFKQLFVIFLAFVPL